MIVTTAQLIELLQTFPQDEPIACPVLWTKKDALAWYIAGYGEDDTKLTDEQWALAVQIFEGGEDFSPAMLEEAVETALNVPEDYPWKII